MRLRSRSRYIQNCYLVCFWDVFTPKGTCIVVWVLSDLSPFTRWKGEVRGILPGSLTPDPPPHSPLCVASLPCFARGSLFLIGACLWWLFTSLIWQSRLVLSKLVCCPLCSLWPGQWKGPHNRCSPGLPSSFQTEKSELVVAFRAACVSPRWRRTEGHVLLCAGVTAGDGSGGRPCFLPDLQLAVQSGEPSLCMFCQDNIQCSKWSN